MAETTEIAWCDATWSPWEGCQKVGPGCDNCYAEARNKRFAAGANWGPGAPRRRTVDWTKPRLWNRAAGKAGRRMKVFPSLCDPFDNAVPMEWRFAFFHLIADTPHLDWLLLTKRIGNAAAVLGDYPTLPLLPNIWLGDTVVTQAEADRDIPKLLAVPARVRFLSIEPMLGPIDLSRWLVPCDQGSRPGPGGVGGVTCADCGGDGHGCQPLAWVIVGGESGPHARPLHPDWARGLRDQCAAAGVPFLFKQWGEWLPAGQDGAPERDEQLINASDVPMRVGKAAAGRLLDGRTHDQFPEVH